jgi:hypothetical protein
VASDRRAELAAQAADYEARLAALREELQDELRHDVRERLMTLAGYRHARGQRTGDRAEDLPARASPPNPEPSQPQS